MNGRRVIIPSEGIAKCEAFEFKGIENDNQISVETHYSVISAGTELAILRGTESWAKMPFVPGYGSVGTVLETGKNVKDIKVGQKVFCYGPHASHAVISDLIFPIPNGLDLQYLPLLRMAAVSITAPRVSSAEFGDLVAVVGMGLVGNIAAQIFQAMGCRVIAIDTMKERLEKIASLGVKYVLQPSDNIKNDIEQLCGELPVTVVDATGIPKVIEQCLSFVAKNGELILLGTPRGEYQTDLQKFLTPFHLARTNVRLKGAHEWVFPRQQTSEKHSIPSNVASLIRAIEDGKIKLEELVSHTISPEEIQSAYNGIKNNPSEYLGVIIDWGK